MSFCGDGRELSGCVRCGEFHEKLRELLMKDRAACSDLFNKQVNAIK